MCLCAYVLTLALRPQHPALVQVEWEETWWESSDWAGYREMGAEKSGCRADGAAWRETWRETIANDSTTGEPTVERSAHKWAHAPGVCIIFCPQGYHSAPGLLHSTCV